MYLLGGEAESANVVASYPGVAAVGGKLYAVGGENNDVDALSYAAVFDPQTQTWAPIAPMSTEREIVKVAAVQGKLYAAGGDNSEGSVQRSVEAYDPQQNHWEAVAPMAQVRHSCGAGAI